MSIPDNAAEHLQQTYRTEFNRRVDRFFRDVEGNGDLSSPRGSLKLACRIADDDNDAIMNMRHNLFFNVIGYSRKNLAVVYGSKFDTAPPVAGHPQLFLYFSQDGAAQPSDEPLIEHEKSCRLMNFSCTSEGVKPTITKADMTAIANEIKTLFLDNKKGITYTTGNKSASYTDPDNGFAKGNYLLVNSKADAVNIYTKMCNAIDVPFKGESHIVLNDPDKASTTTATAGKTTILGKQRNNRRYRPIAILRFRYAYISLGNLIPPVFLIDTTFRNQSLVSFL
ncbi:hypothetical protein CDG76_30715 [Nostoc sp. 'Peltigera membranacea cyanobiont' 210A]|uniref:hypothetical protein n=1 Tax=Nostoc sp. 'Peltigera membranacea cyanobiont' 210A TaxID=2014529 RepID=UPI000B95229F|nr:hypothetical protein [Nostoc sp. 'Peltigera membranacea cyanobiont' 210A]OYD90599.1 hypothetical protein CDG76_30715 [Nostoc sp. 'Peltigera membranacea cyanobiont' 210A]